MVTTGMGWDTHTVHHSRTKLEPRVWQQILGMETPSSKLPGHTDPQAGASQIPKEMS